jgi:putative sterol carrier protein
MTAQDVFARLAANRTVPSLLGAHGSCRFEIEGAGVWRIDIRDGEVTVRRAGKQVADCSIACSESDFTEIAGGRRNAVTAIMQGRVVFKGDVQQLVLLQRLFLELRKEAEAHPEERP